MSVDAGQPLKLELTSTVEALPLPAWQEIDRRSTLSFIADRRLAGAVVALLLLAALATITLTGIVSIVDDPDGALATRHREGHWDFSVGLRLAIDPDRPYVIEVRKILADESIIVHLPAD